MLARVELTPTPSPRLPSPCSPVAFPPLPSAFHVLLFSPFLLPCRSFFFPFSAGTPPPCSFLHLTCHSAALSWTSTRERLGCPSREDVDDPERVGIHETHLGFYYNKYYRKQLNPKYFGVSTNAELVKLAKDCCMIDGEVLASNLEDDKIDELDHFVKLTEENRRERQRRIDAGDETARLPFLDAVVACVESSVLGLREGCWEASGSRLPRAVFYFSPRVCSRGQQSDEEKVPVPLPFRRCSPFGSLGRPLSPRTSGEVRGVAVSVPFSFPKFGSNSWEL
ncbi:unnamed protein product [Prorocentrum cordatum]|uniref:Uncharacterized protein n=1 Tax=Prorocentrum cordatum TaxID=2364126 RepID=A0ABN9PJQ4_9DINO|nr:unnamed protein product [Polarella glacialis]